MDNVSGDMKPEISEESSFEEPSTKPQKLPNPKYDYNIARRYLNKMGANEESVWEILTDALQKVAEYQGEMTIGKFQEIVRNLLRKNKLRTIANFREVYEPPKSLNLCQKVREFLTSLHYKWDPEERLSDPNVIPEQNTLEKLRLLIDAGVGLSKDEFYHILIALKRVTENTKIVKARFWGKVYGLKKNYYIIEIDPDPGMINVAKEAEQMLSNLAKADAAAETARMQMKRQEEDIAEKLRGMKEEVAAIKEGIIMALTEPEKKDEVEQPGLLAKYVLPPVPQPPSFKEIVTPPEPLGEGPNWKQYFVANELWEPFVLLPEVTPTQITTARTLHRYFTGDLEHEFDSFPPFPGKEKHLLRAQIARITASTTICPVGYYISQIGEEEILDEDIPGGFMENPDYHPPPLKWLLHSDRKYWMHCRHFILPQGRCKYWKKPSEEEGEFDEGASGFDDDELRGRFAPPPLTLISRDDNPEVEKCWSIRRAFRTMGKNQIVIVKSNVWPGALCANRGYIFENVYVGWGLKANANFYFPPSLPNVWFEYEQGPEIMEITDPTPDEEEAWRLAHMPKVMGKEFLGEGGEGGEDDFGIDQGDEEDV